MGKYFNGRKSAYGYVQVQLLPYPPAARQIKTQEDENNGNNY